MNATPVMTNSSVGKPASTLPTNKNEAKALAGEALGYFQFSGGESNNVWSRLEVR